MFSDSVIEKYIDAIDKTHVKAQNLSSWNQRPGDLKPNYRDRILRCYAYVLDAGTCFRANTMYDFVDLNAKADHIIPHFVSEPCNVHPNSKVDPKSNVSSTKDLRFP